MMALLVVVGNVAVAQPTAVTANPDTVLLRRIWMVMGEGFNDGEEVGKACGGIPDINGDGLGEIAVYFGKAGEWRVYLGANGAPFTSPIWTFDTATSFPHYPIVGDFWGTNHPALGFVTYRWNESHTLYFYMLYLFPTESGRVADTPRVILDPYRTLTPAVTFNPDDIQVQDMDRDGDDELIVVNNILQRDGVLSNNAEVWIFKGGPGFQVDTPTVIVRDPEANTGTYYYAALGDFDGDSLIDLVTAGTYNDTAKLKFWWGRAGSPWNWTTPDRTITLSSEGHPRIGYGITALDCDGDGALDLFLPGPDGAFYLYRSGAAGKNARTRSFTLEDADRRFRHQGLAVPAQLGYLNDSSRRFQMAAMVGTSFSGNGSMLIGLSGSASGPNETYDCYYTSERDGLGQGNVLSNIQPVPDCNGDGWDDLIVSNGNWGAFGSVRGRGIAMVLAGGPYIPRDSGTSSVHDIAAEGHADAIAIWPNPARDLLTIAWRGDLRHMPARFSVHDALGREVARGDAEPWRGQVVYNCAGLPGGPYLIALYDERGALITTTRIIKL